jgi:hypothetical protein
MRVVAVIAMPVLALVLSACASQATDKPEADPTVAQARACERGEAQTGSMLAKRVCAPKPSEEERQRLAEEAARMARPARGTTGAGN